MIVRIPALREQHAAEQQCGVDRRQFGTAKARARLPVEKVVEKALVSGSASGFGALRGLGEEPQGGERAGARLRAADPTLHHADRIRRQRKTDGSDAGEGWGRPAIGREAGCGIGRIPEIAEGAVLDVRDQRLAP
ncbi:hypothetical protein D9M73_151460 [compost metagenome]